MTAPIRCPDCGTQPVERPVTAQRGDAARLSGDPLNEAVQALYARLSETRSYLRTYESTGWGQHDDCCPRHVRWMKSRAAERDSLRKREGDILAALHLLDPDDDEGGSR